MITDTPTNSKMPQTFTAKGSAIGQQEQTAYSFKSNQLQNKIQYSIYRKDRGDTSVVIQ